MNNADLTTFQPAISDSGISYVRGAIVPSLSDATVAALLLNAASNFADHPAAVFRAQGVRYTWRQLAEAVDVLAAGLLCLEIKCGDRVGIWAHNRYEWLLTQFATARIGAILVSLNPSYLADELEYALNKSSCKALVISPHFRSTALLESIVPDLRAERSGFLCSARVPDLRVVIRMGDEPATGMVRFSDVSVLGKSRFSNLELDRILDSLHPDDPINIQFTSGTTGRAKGATLTHFNIVNNARYVASAMKLTASDAICVPVPLYHCFGMVLSVLAAVSVGATMVFPSETFDPEAAIAAVSAERCTALQGVPAMFIAELALPTFGDYDVSSLRTGIMGGSPCPIEVMKRLIGEMHMRDVTIAYGMTETSPVSFQSEVTDPIERRTTTVGHIGPHLEAKLVDEDGRIVPTGVVGELCTRGYSVMKGYWNDDRATAAVVIDGWMHTGDLAIFDNEGYCNIVGRLTDMIIRGGENIYPTEIEAVLFQHPKVQSAQVFGIPDDKYGEGVCAWIILKPGEQATADELESFCSSRIAFHKVPRTIRFVENMPMTVSGKPQKFVMRQRMMDALDLPEIPTA